MLWAVAVSSSISNTLISNPLWSLAPFWSLPVCAADQALAHN
jgi:hypothetical protein